MKTSKEQVARNRERILEAASEGFRKHGFDGLKVADLMKQAGLTHGGFYGYFDSKDDLAVAACRAALKGQGDRLKAAKDGDPATELRAYFERYLSRANRDNPENACLFPALSAEVARQGAPVRAVFTDGLRDYLGALAGLSDRDARGDLPKNAIAILSTLVGAMLLARAVDDEAFSNSLLDVAKEALNARYAADEAQ
jgi:TetR/AcrR family transcriptional repressor of nem operon